MMAKIFHKYNTFKTAIIRWLTYVILAVGPAFLFTASKMTKEFRTNMDGFDWTVFVVAVFILPTASITRSFIDKTMSKIEEANKNI